MALLRQLWIVPASAALAALTFGVLHGGAGMPPGLAGIVGTFAGCEFGWTMLKSHET